MQILYMLFMLFLILIIYTIVLTIIKIALYLTTKYIYEDNRLFLPTIFTFIIWCMVFAFFYYLTVLLTKQTIFQIITDTILKVNPLQNQIKPLFMITAITTIILIVLQSFSYFSVNINLKYLIGKIRFFIKTKIFCIHYDSKRNTNYEKIKRRNQLIIKNKFENLTFTNSFIASLFSFCMIFFITIMLFLLGHYLANYMLT